ncbi:KRAB [Mytilus coruscus]|uniref:KRAB n=1 Tax=Mytilus coruscus TaxID=42192 RepID=A0A6J8D647_MYTCO|nr:KRAB [Mytilus coruscus]
MDSRGTPLSNQYELDSLCVQESCELDNSITTKSNQHELVSSCDKDNSGILIPIMNHERENGSNKLSNDDTCNKKQTLDCSSVAENVVAKINERQFCDTSIKTDDVFHQNNLDNKFINTKDNVKIRSSLEAECKLDDLYDIKIKVEKDEEYQPKLFDCSSEINSDNCSATAELAIKIECNEWTLNASGDYNNKTKGLGDITNNVVPQNPFEKAITVDLNKVKQEVSDGGRASDEKPVDRHTVEKTININDIKQEVYDVIRNFNEQAPFFRDEQTENDAVADDGEEGSEEQIHMYIQDNSPWKDKFPQIGKVDKKMVECEVCHNTKDDKLIHMRKDHSDEYKFGCNQCLEVYRQEKQFEQHMRSHLGIKPYKCEICNKHFTQTSSLNLHLKIHTGEKKFSCDICDKLFRTKHGLRKHSLTHTRVKDPGEECETCGLMFRNEQALQCHMHIHSKDYVNSTISILK